MKRITTFLALAVICCLGIMVLSSSVMATTFVVTNTADTGPGSLRNEITNANTTAGRDTIIFNIPPGGPVTIFPASQLPALIDPSGLVIDGFTQPGGATPGATPPSSAILLVEIDGVNAGPAHGIWILSSTNELKGLCINNFEQDGVCIEGGIAEPNADFNAVYSCFIGTDLNGTADKGNGTNGLSLWAGVMIKQVPNGFATENNILQNLISGNYAEGVAIWGPQVPGDVWLNHVVGNYIGTDITGTVDLGNDHVGVNLSEGTHENDIGDNLISGNDYDGVGIQGYDNEQFPAPPIYTWGNIIIGNIIGLDVSLNPLGNTMHGVAIGEYGPSQWGFATENQVLYNTISDNGTDGVAVLEHPLDAANADFNLISQNNIYLNGGLGIDLYNNGVTLNDPTDPDVGPNQELNFPVIDSAVDVGGTVTVYGTIDIDTDPTQATIEVFLVLVPDPTGYGEGDQYLGSTTADAAGNWSYTTAALVLNDLVSATVSDLSNNTSEFSSVAQVSSQVQTGACCFPDGSCSSLTQANCGQQGGSYQGDGTSCLGDNNANNIDDLCEQPDLVVCEPQGGNNPNHPPTYWYDVTPGGVTGRLDFHVIVFDSVLANYSNWVEPAGWQHTVHKVGADWWVSWWEPTGANPIYTTFRFQFDNNNPSVWSDWSTTSTGTNNPIVGQVDMSLNHTADMDGYGYHVHVPQLVEEIPDTCEYYKAPYEDYAPAGMPDFDQKQNSWIYPGTGMWSHCGPVALANCFWWFDSKFETNVTPPPAVIDNYPLVTSFGGPPWDDHDAQNVIPFVDSLAVYCNTNGLGSGTAIFDMDIGARNWLTKVGLDNAYTVRMLPIDGTALDFERIREEVLASQDVILLMGFYEEVEPGLCERIGGHYVTTAGVCTSPEDSALCISDPYYDRNEGEPPAGSAHASSIHNDAQFVSGPHGTIHHDRYDVIPANCVFPTGIVFQLELQNYPISSSDVMQFYNQNHYDPSIPSVMPQGNPIHTILEWAIIICPADTCDYQTPGDVNDDGSIDISDLTYMTSYLLTGGPPPTTLANGDVNGDCTIDLRDLVCLTRYLQGLESCIVSCTCQNPDTTNKTICCYQMRGNVNYDYADIIDISDLLYLVDYMFLQPPGPVPPCPEEADVNGSIVLDISDLLYLVDYMFLQPPGPAPVSCP